VKNEAVPGALTYVRGKSLELHVVKICYNYRADQGRMCKEKLHYLTYTQLRSTADWPQTATDTATRQAMDDL
jgi:hypothetical protein